MSNHIVHMMEAEGEVIFAHSADPAYLALVGADSYQFFVSPDLDYDGMLAHLGKQMGMRACVAWGCPEGLLEVRCIFTRDDKGSEAMRQYASGFQRWLGTKGRLYFSSHAELYHCATDSGWKMFSFPRTPASDVVASRELVVPAGIYSVTVFRHFAWFEGAQDALLLGDGPQYTVILRQYEDESQLGPLSPLNSIPWTMN